MEKLKPTWNHPGGKLIELGPAALTDEELLAILIGSGYRGTTAQDIAEELLDKYYSIAGLLGKTLFQILQICNINPWIWLTAYLEACATRRKRLRYAWERMQTPG
jgi:DNA repair protein RadC